MSSSSPPQPPSASSKNAVNDSCIPDVLKDFVFDLHDSVRSAQIPSEQSILYGNVFHNLTAKYFSSTPWPSAQSIASECSNDKFFLALYSELTLRHQHSISRPSVRDRVDGWHSYRALFDLILNEYEQQKQQMKDSPSSESFFLLPEWTFDMLHEFVYQFQGFCQCRTAAFANASKFAAAAAKHTAEQKEAGNEENDDGDEEDEDGEKSTKKNLLTSSQLPPQPPHHVTETIDVLSQNKDAWAVETVLFYLCRLSAIATECAANDTPENNNRTWRHFGVFARVTLSRLECLLGDYTASLKALEDVSGILFDSPLSAYYNTSAKSTILSNNKDELLSKTNVPKATELVKSVFSARLSVAYHAGVSYLMLRRYKDAIAVLGEMCAVLQRGFKSGRLYGVTNYAASAQSNNNNSNNGNNNNNNNNNNNGLEQYRKLYDRMIALLAILTHVCSLESGSNTGITSSDGNNDKLPTNRMDNGVLRAVGDRHRSQLSKIEAGEEGYEDMFMFACPKFINPAVPNYDNLSSSSSSSSTLGTTSGQEAYKLQIRHFMNEMVCQRTLRKLRSYMQLYTSISVEKLGRLVMEEEFESLILSYKHKTRQIECRPSSSSSSSASSSEGGGEPCALEGKVGTVMDIHYYVQEDVVHVDEAEKRNRFERYFLGQIGQCFDIIRDVETVNTVV